MISVHAISMIYELRSLRSRLRDIVSREWTLGEDPRMERELRYMLNMVELLIRKTERTGEYIAKLQAREDEATAAAEAADLGAYREHRDSDH